VNADLALLIQLVLVVFLAEVAVGSKGFADEPQPQGVSGSPSARPPNVLFIAVDDLNDWIQPLGGHPDARTPNLDRLAERGVLFTRAYCSAPACNPSRASLLSGVHPTTSGVYHNQSPWRRAMADLTTLPRWYRKHGYHVAGGGKIFHGTSNDPDAWDEYVRQSRDPLPEDRPLNGIPQAAHFDWGPIDVPEESMGDRKIADWAARFLSEPREKPFFLAVGFYRPHLPWHVPREWFRDFAPESVKLPEVKEGDLDDVPAAGKAFARRGDHRRVVERDQWRKAVASYLASMRFVDAMIGRVIDALDSGPHASRTIVVLWGDHGWHLGEKEHWRKFALWEEATRVPLMVVAPGVTKEKSRSARTVSLLDLYPTLVELCDLPRPEWLEGRSLVPLLSNPTSEWDRPVVTTHGLGNHAVRSERYRLIRYADGSEELYDHEKDPREWTNIASLPESKEIIEKLERFLPTKEAPETKRPARAERGEE